MITFENGIDIRCRNVLAPSVARIRVRDNVYVYCVIGTAYGYWHTTGGDVRIWQTASGAYRAVKRYPRCAL